MTHTEIFRRDEPSAAEGRLARFRYPAAAAGAGQGLPRLSEAAVGHVEPGATGGRTGRPGRDEGRGAKRLELEQGRASVQSGRPVDHRREGRRGEVERLHQPHEGRGRLQLGELLARIGLTRLAAEAWPAGCTRFLARSCFVNLLRVVNFHLKISPYCLLFLKYTF